jgi:hypothetical protein
MGLRELDFVHEILYNIFIKTIPSLAAERART